MIKNLRWFTPFTFLGKWGSSFPGRHGPLRVYADTHQHWRIGRGKAKRFYMFNSIYVFVMFVTVGIVLPFFLFVIGKCYPSCHCWSSLRSCLRLGWYLFRFQCLYLRLCLCLGRFLCQTMSVSVIMLACESVFMSLCLYRRLFLYPDI